MRALVAALAVALATAVPAHAADSSVSATCTATAAEFLLDHAGVGELHAVAVADGSPRGVSTAVSCTADWQYVGDMTVSATAPGPVAVAAGAGAAGGTVILCV